MSKRRYIKLTCHICAVHTGFGRTIKVIGLYSICDWCFKNVITNFAEKFNTPEDQDRALPID